MHIILDGIKKEGVLLKEDGTEVSRYSYKTLIKDGFTVDDLKEELEGFNKTLGMYEEFDDISGLTEPKNVHNW